jgi:hypothetical protein
MKNMTIRTLLTAGALALSTIAAHAEYEQVNLTVFGMIRTRCERVGRW